MRLYACASGPARVSQSSAEETHDGRGALAIAHDLAEPIERGLRRPAVWREDGVDRVGDEDPLMAASVSAAAERADGHLKVLGLQDEHKVEDLAGRRDELAVFR